MNPPVVGGFIASSGRRECSHRGKGNQGERSSDSNSEYEALE